MPEPQVAVDLVHQTQGVLPLRRGGAGAQMGHALGVYDAIPNVAGASLPLGSLVRMETGYVVTGVIPCTTDFDPLCIGVVGGEYLSDGTVVNHAVPDPGLAYVVRKGWANVLVGTTVTRLHYLAASTTSGQAQDVPGQTAGAIAQAWADGTAGNLVYSFVDVGAIGTSGNSSGFLSIVTLEAGDFSSDVGTGLGTYKGVPFAGTVVGAILEAPGSSTATVDILKANASVVLVSGTNSICGTDYPALSAATWAYQAATVNWTTAVAVNDVFRLDVRSVSAGCKRLTLQVVIRQT